VSRQCVTPIAEHVHEPRRGVDEIGLEEPDLADVSQVRLVPAHHRLLPLQPPGELAHLHDADHGLQVRELEVESHDVVHVGAPGRAAEIFKPPQARGKRIVVADDGSPLTGGDDLRYGE
jgi:hypothetical protein